MSAVSMKRKVIKNIEIKSLIFSQNLENKSKSIIIYFVMCIFIYEVVMIAISIKYMYYYDSKNFPRFL